MFEHKNIVYFAVSLPKVKSILFSDRRSAGRGGDRAGEGTHRECGGNKDSLTQISRAEI